MSVTKWQHPRSRSSPDSFDQFDRTEPGDVGRIEIGNLAVGIAMDPIMAGNEVTLNAENCPNARIAGVVFEKHFHFGSTTSSVDESSKEFFRSSASSSRCAFASLADLYIRSHSWICPLDSGPRYGMEDLYVGLKLKLLDRNGRAKHGDARKKKILFEPFNRTNVTPRTVLVIGGPGYGKTTLCRKMAYDWAGQGKTFPEFVSEEAVILYLDMSNLSRNANLEEELVKLSTQEEGVVPDSTAMLDTAEILKTYDRNVIVVLDGYVEIHESLQLQIRELIRSRPNSIFKAASIVVTSRPGLNEETMLMFHKHFYLKGFSVGLAQKLMFKYFKRSSNLLGAYFADILKRFEMKNLSPLVILALCDCEVNLECGFNRFETLNQLAVRLGEFCNTRNGLGMTSEQVREGLDRLGLLFWKSLCKKKDSFNRHDLQLSMKDYFEFAVSCGLLKTTKDFNILEPIHPVFMESIAMYHLERHWLFCWTSENVSSFLKTFFPKLPSLQISCYTNHRNSDVLFRVSFDYRDFRMCFAISDNECKFQMLKSASDLATDSRDNGLSISYRYSLRSKRDSEGIVPNLRRLFNNEKGLNCLAQFISSAQFGELHLLFITPCSSSIQPSFPKELKECVVSNQSTQHPLSLLRTLCQELHVTFLKSACTSFFVRSVLECILETPSAKLEFHNEYHIVEHLGAVIVKPPFAAAHVYGSKTIYYSNSECARVRTWPQLNVLCDRLELIFRSNVTLDNSTDVLSFL